MAPYRMVLDFSAGISRLDGRLHACRHAPVSRQQRVLLWPPSASVAKSGPGEGVNVRE